MSKKKLFIIGGVILLIILAIIIFKKNNRGNENTYTVKKDLVSDELVLAGVIDAEKRANLGFAAGGRLSKNYFNEGDFVKKGQVIAELDQNTLKSSLIQANANYALTRVDTQTSISDVKDSYETVVQEQNTVVEGLKQQYLSGDLQAYLDDENTSRSTTAPIVSGNYIGEEEGVYHLEIYSSAASSGFSYRLSGLEFGTYTGEVNQSGKLGQYGLYVQFGDDSYKNTEWEISVPNKRSATYLARKTAYENSLVSRTRTITAAENTRDGVLATDSQTQTSRSQAQLNNARAQVSSAYSRLSDGKITAPFSGYIAKNDLEVGEIVNAFETSIVMFKDDAKKLLLNTPEIYINKVHVGDIVSVRVDAYPDVVFEGEVSSIDSIDTLIDGVPAYKTDVKILNADDRIRVGMNAHANIIASQREDVLAIPQHFIVNDNNVSKVMILDGEDTIERIIETGLKGNNALIEVISGLSLGEVLVFEEK